MPTSGGSDDFVWAVNLVEGARIGIWPGSGSFDDSLEFDGAEHAALQSSARSCGRI